MKTTILSIAIIGSSLIYSPVFSQGQVKDSLGLPGDNFNLYAVLDVFQQCKTLEEFEGKINASDSKINNLDLNGDNKIDYIKVVDNGEGTMHAIVLKDEISEKEMQDVAVIEVDKVNGKIKIQIVGDEQLYGKNYIVEPKDQNDNASGGTPNPGYSGGQGTTVINNTTNNYYDNDNYYRENRYNDGYYGGRTVVYVPVDNWYMWDYLYGPSYVFYASPWSWGYYPNYWNPWAPLYWHEYYGYHYHRYGYFERTVVCRTPVVNGYYGPRRTVSVTVTERTKSRAYTTTYGRRDLLTKSIETNRASMQNKTTRPNNENVKPNREEPRNNNVSKERENQPRNENQQRNEAQPRNENQQKNETRPRNENQQRNEARPRNENKVNQEKPRNNTKESKPDRNNNQAPKQSHSEKREARVESRHSFGGGGGQAVSRVGNGGGGGHSMNRGGGGGHRR